MSTATRKPEASLDAAIEERLAQDAKRTVEYTPLGCASPIKLSPVVVYRYFAARTKQGARAPAEMVEIFLKVCESMKLNPFNRDAWIVGYDGKGGPEFSIITSIQALLKRAETHGEYDGLECGLLLEGPEGIADEYPGQYYRRGKDKILGAWCRVYRKDRGRPTFVSIPFETRAKDNKFWRDDPGWMICKCAKAAALREAFPQEMGGLYTEDEIGDNAKVLDDAIANTTRKGLSEKLKPAPVVETADEEHGDAYEPDEDEVEAIQRQLIETHPNAAEV